MDDSIDLGDKFRYIQDYPQTIIYHNTKEYKGTGVNVVDPVVIAYSFDDRYIIAKSREEEIIKRNDSVEKTIRYWIIDKKEKLDSVKPMDSVNFYKQLRDLKIELKLKE
jgi:hypothetical protein